MQWLTRRATGYRARLTGPAPGCPATLAPSAFRLCGHVCLRFTAAGGVLPESLAELGLAIRFPVDALGRPLLARWRILPLRAGRPRKRARYQLEARLPDTDWCPVAELELLERAEIRKQAGNLTQRIKSDIHPS